MTLTPLSSLLYFLSQTFIKHLNKDCARRLTVTQMAGAVFVLGLPIKPHQVASHPSALSSPSLLSLPSISFYSEVSCRPRHLQDLENVAVISLPQALWKWRTFTVPKPRLGTWEAHRFHSHFWLQILNFAQISLSHEPVTTRDPYQWTLMRCDTSCLPSTKKTWVVFTHNLCLLGTGMWLCWKWGVHTCG